jgi:predicted  nucleic acid-binding Zn-ribbon protein
LAKVEKARCRIKARRSQASLKATERLIQDEKNLIASSKQEVEGLTTQLKTELAELSALSRQIISGEDKDDEAAIAEADYVRLEAIAAINEFLQ